MAYGRLDVFFPDGIIKSFPLNDDNISIGRSPGNTIPLETDTISRYHMSFSRRGGETVVTDLDSANGTFVDGTRLNHDEPRVLHGGEEILIGELILLYHDIDESPTRPVDVPEEQTRHIEAVEAQFSVTVEAPEIAISPGAHTSARVLVINQGEESQRYVIEVNGVPKDWIRIDRPEVEVRPGETEDAMISFKPLRRPESTPGNYAVVVLVRPKNQLAQQVSAEVPLRILAYSGFGMAIEARQIRTGESFRLHLHNQGSGALPLSLSARDLDANGGALKFTLPNAQMILAPGQRAVISGQAAPRRSRLTGDTRRYPFDLLVRSGDPSGFLVSTRAYLLDKPSFPRWGLFAIIGGLLAIAALAVVLLLVLFTPAPAPEIQSFSAPPLVEQGQPLLLGWSARNADHFEIQLNGTPAGAFDGQTSASINTAGLEGQVNVALIAANTSVTAVATAVVYVEAPFTVASFLVAPQPLMLYVEQQITVSWNVPNATSVRLVASDDVIGPIDLTAQGEQTFTATITNPNLTLQLMATDAAGESIQSLLTVQTVSPICLPAAQTLVYDAPGTTANVIATVPAGEQIIVSARDTSSAWLRAELVGGVHGWIAREGLECSPTFSPDDLAVDINAPVPPTATATPLPVTPTVTGNFALTATALARSRTPAATPSPPATATPAPTRSNLDQPPPPAGVLSDQAAPTATFAG